MPTEQRPPETGWLPDTPVGDTLLRRFVHNQADANAALARALGGRVERTEDLFLADAGTPVSYLNQALLARPLHGPHDPALDVVDGFFPPGTRPATLLSLWPTPDLSHRGWSLTGHPVMVVRAPGPVRHEPRVGVSVKTASGTMDFAAAERVAVDGFPLEAARGVPAGWLFPPSVSDGGLVVRLGLLDGEPVAVGNAYTAHGLVNLCLAATLGSARRKGVWEALVWARVNDAPDLPAVAYTSDDSRPGFVARGFLPVTRFTLWHRPAGTEAG